MLPNTDVGNQCTAKRYETFPDEVLSLIFTLLLLSLKRINKFLAILDSKINSCSKDSNFCLL